MQGLGLIRHDPEQPGPKRRADPEAGEAAVGLDERLLHHVIGVGTGTEQQGGALGKGQIPSHQLGKGSSVARYCRCQQAGFGDIIADLSPRSHHRPILLCAAGASHHFSIA